MRMTIRKLLDFPASRMTVTSLALLAGLNTPVVANADEANAKSLLKNMSDYMSEQKNLSFNYDTNFEVITQDQQKLALASSGTVLMKRPDQLRITRSGGFAEVEILFDGKNLTLFGKNANLFTQISAPGTVDHLVDELRDKYNRPVPAADLLMSDVQKELMDGVIDIKDLGSGVIGGVECDHLAFRTKEVDWQIWIAQGSRPYPCRYVITSKQINGGPQYSIQISDWKSGAEVAPHSFVFKNTTNAKKIDVKDLPNTDDLPENFVRGDTQ